MSKELRKIATLLLAVIMIVSVAAGCGNAEQKTSEAAPTESGQGAGGQGGAPQSGNSWEIDTSPVTLNVFIDTPGVAHDKYWGKDDVSKKWIQDTGVNLSWTIASDAEHTKLNVLLASGDIPDLLYASPGLSQVKDLAKNDKIWALNELAEKAAPNFMNNFEKHMLVNLRMIFDSQNVYMTPFNYIKTEYMDSPYVVKNMAGMLVLDKVYEAIGKPEIKNGDDFINALRMVKEKYPDLIGCQSHRNPGPDSDGNPNIIGMTLSIAGLSQKYYQQGDGYVKYWEHPNFIKLLKFVNTLYNEGLMDKTEFTDQLEQLRGKLFAGKVFADLNQDADNLDWYTDELHKVKPDESWVAIEPFTLDPATMKYTNDSINGGVGLTESAKGLAISKNSKYSDRAIRFIDYLMQDQTQKELVFGIEGRGHVMKDGIPVYTPEEQEIDKKDVEQMRMIYGCTAYWCFRDDYWNRIRNMAGASERQNEAFKIAGGHYEDLYFYQNADSFPRDSDEQKIAITIKEYYQTEIIKIIMAKPDQVEDMYNTMIQKMKQLGLDKLNAYWTKYFNEKEAKIKQYSE